MIELQAGVRPFHTLLIGLAAIIAIGLLTQTVQPRTVISPNQNLPQQMQSIARGPAPITGAFTAQNTACGQGLCVLGAPTINVAQIEKVLAEYNSPAQGQGQQIYDLGVRYGINPAIMLAFFVQESSAGSHPAWAGRKADGQFTYNVGNIICTSGWRCYGRFRDYNSWNEGIEDWYKLIKDLYIGEWQRTTVEDIIPRYAPAADNNDEAAYINAVRNLVQSWQGK